MNASSAEDPIVIKTLELCNTVVAQPEFVSIQQRVNTFMADESAKSHYQQVSEQGEYLQHKQEQGVELSQEEISAFEESRNKLVATDSARGFLEAQDEIRKIQDSIGQYLSKTFELGKAPAVDEMEFGCGPSCGCH